MLPNLGGLRLEQHAPRDERDECEPTGPFCHLTPRQEQERRDNDEVCALTLEYLEANRRRGMPGATFRLPTHGRDGRNAQNRWTYYDAQALAQHVRTQRRTRNTVRDPVTNTLIHPTEVRELLRAYPHEDPQYVQELPEAVMGGAGEAPEWLRRAPDRGPVLFLPDAHEQRNVLRPFARPVHFEWQTGFQRGLLASAAGALLPASLVPGRTQVYNFLTVDMPVGATVGAPEAAVGERARVTAFYDYIDSMHGPGTGRASLDEDTPQDLVDLRSAFLPKLNWISRSEMLKLLDGAYREVRAERRARARALIGLVSIDNDADFLESSLISSSFYPEVVNPDLLLDQQPAPQEGAPWILRFDVRVQLVRLLVLHKIQCHEARRDDAPTDLVRLVREIRDNKQAGRALTPTTEELKALLAPPPAEAEAPRRGGAGYLQWQGQLDRDHEPAQTTWKHVLGVLIEGVKGLVRKQINDQAEADESPPQNPVPFLDRNPSAFELAAPPLAEFRAWERVDDALWSPAGRLARAYAWPRPELTNLNNSEWTRSSWWPDVLERTVTVTQKAFAHIPIAYYSREGAGLEA